MRIYVTEKKQNIAHFPKLDVWRFESRQRHPTLKSKLVALIPMVVLF
jgi:hypothetical protein